MTNKQILQEALGKAVKNSGGFGVGLMLGKYEVDSRTGWLNGKNQEEPYIKQISPGGMMEREVAYQVVIFSHEFAKAFWGTARRGYNFQKGKEIQEWDHHLQQMVLEEDPIKYLEKFL